MKRECDNNNPNRWETTGHELIYNLSIFDTHQGCIRLVDLIGGGLDIPISYKYTLSSPPTAKIKTFFQSMKAT